LPSSSSSAAARLHAFAYNLGNFLRSLAKPEPIKDSSLTSLKEKLIQIGAKLVSHGPYVAFQMAEVAIPRIPATNRRTPAATTTSAGVAGSVLMRSNRNQGRGVS
jgi:hypothetical protein